jgi:hypothetical protein
MALIVKAATQTDAERKAWATLANYIYGANCPGEIFDYGKKFIRSCYPPLAEQPRNESDSYLINLGNSGYFVRDEEGRFISDQNDSRLKSSEYFVVSVDVHS